MKDSRDVKEKIELNRGANLQGTLTSPKGSEYLFCMFMYGVGMKNLKKKAKEIRDFRNHNYILFAKSATSYSTIVQQLSTNNTVIVKCQSLKIFPYTFAKYYLRLFEDETHVMKFLEDYEIYDLSFKTSSISRRKKQYDGLE